MQQLDRDTELVFAVHITVIPIILVESTPLEQRHTFFLETVNRLLEVLDLEGNMMHSLAPTVEMLFPKRVGSHRLQQLKRQVWSDVEERKFTLPFGRFTTIPHLGLMPRNGRAGRRRGLAEESGPALATSIHILTDNCDLNDSADAGVSIGRTLAPY